MTRHPRQPHRTLLCTGLTAFFLIFIILYYSVSAQAYITCSPVTMLQALEGSDAVFLGKLVEIVGKNRIQKLGKEVLIPGGYFSQEHHFKFEVEKVWKGKVANPVTFVAPGPPFYPGSFHWRVQNQYVVLVYKDELNGDGFSRMTAGSSCLSFMQVQVWHKKWDMIFLDFLTNKTWVAKVLHEARRLTVQPWENLGPAINPSSETFFQPKVLKSFFRIMLDGLKEWNQVEEYGRLAEVLGLAVQRNEKVSSALFELFQKMRDRLEPGHHKGKLGHRERSVFVMALALMESGDQHIQNQAATFLSQTIQYKIYWLYNEDWLVWRAELSLKKVGKWN